MCHLTIVKIQKIETVHKKACIVHDIHVHIFASRIHLQYTDSFMQLEPGVQPARHTCTERATGAPGETWSGFNVYILKVKLTKSTEVV